MLKWMKSRRRDRVIRRRFGTTHPRQVRVLAGDHDLAIDPDDGRVRKILLYDTARGRRKTNQVFWLEAVAALQPTIAIDVGLNYGECLFSAHYPSDVVLHGFEANPSLLPYLRQTCSGHPSDDMVTVHANAVSDVTGETVHLSVDAAWSGSSHLTSTPGCSTVAIKSVRLDDAVARPSKSDRVLLKVDVEGFEPPVLRGTSETIAAAGTVLGFVEFSPELMHTRGHDVDAYWDALREQFTIYLCTETGEARPIPSAPWSHVSQTIRQPHCDLILVAGERCEELEQFFKAWRPLANSRTV